jgi:hypothetical protein
MRHNVGDRGTDDYFDGRDPTALQRGSRPSSRSEFGKPHVHGGPPRPGVGIQIVREPAGTFAAIERCTDGSSRVIARGTEAEVERLARDCKQRTTPNAVGRRPMAASERKRLARPVAA